MFKNDDAFIFAITFNKTTRTVRATIINNVNPNSVAFIETPEDVYYKWYKLYQEEQFIEVLAKMDNLIIQFTGDEIVPKFDLLKANTIGKLRGLKAYKNAMQFVADNYSLSEEGKKAQEILTTEIPSLEKMSFGNGNESKNWNIMYKVSNQDNKTASRLQETVKKFFIDEKNPRLNQTVDIYTETENFISIHGIKTEAYAKNVAAILRDDKKYKVTEKAIVISSKNYTVVQIKKNLAEYLAPQKTVVVPTQPAVPNPVAPTSAVPETAADTILSADDDQSPNQLAPTTTQPAQPKTKAAKTKPPGGNPDPEDKSKSQPTSTPNQ